ncbi:MAG: amidohydrolase family protein [Cyclobacteriaceae bacterium]
MMNKRTFIKNSLLAAMGISIDPGTRFSRDLRAYEKLPLVDTHLHLWDLQVMDYPWLQNGQNPLGRNFLLPDYQEATVGIPVSKMVFVECARLPEQYLQEVEWVEKQSVKDPRIKGMVAYFPLELGADAIPELESLSQRKLVRGIRKEMMFGDKQFMEGVGQLSNFNLSYDLNVRPRQMESALQMVKQFPNLTFILDHIGNPDIKSGDYRLWASMLKPFSEMEHVSCKISGMITKVEPGKWDVEDLRPYFDTVLETFGPDRILFGGDWPVVLRGGSYLDWIKVFNQMAGSLSEIEKGKLFYRNAERIYRI